MGLVSLFAAFVPARVVGEMTSIGTLFAFILVCMGIIVMRRKMPDAPRAFRTPLVPLVPILGIVTCLYMMIALPPDTWIRLLVWMLVGFNIYFSYGIYRSELGNGTEQRSGFRQGIITGIVIAVLLAASGYWHHADLTSKAALATEAYNAGINSPEAAALKARADEALHDANNDVLPMVAYIFAALQIAYFIFKLAMHKKQPA